MQTAAYLLLNLIFVELKVRIIIFIITIISCQLTEELLETVLDKLVVVSDAIDNSSKTTDATLNDLQAMVIAGY